MYDPTQAKFEQACQSAGITCDQGLKALQAIAPVVSDLLVRWAEALPAPVAADDSEPNDEELNTYARVVGCLYPREIEGLIWKRGSYWFSGIGSVFPIDIFEFDEALCGKPEDKRLYLYDCKRAFEERKRIMETPAGPLVYMEPTYYYSKTMVSCPLMVPGVPCLPKVVK